LSDAQGNGRWDNLRIPTLNISSTYAADRWYYILIMCFSSYLEQRGAYFYPHYLEESFFRKL
jgi:hypothetical protein